MDSKIVKLMNEQINKELYSAYLYLQFADYYAEAGLDGYANYYEIQAAEERDHALIFRKYLHSCGEKVKLDAIAKPDSSFNDFLGPLEAALEHEKFITDSINKIYAAADKIHDYRTMLFLDWFIDEQGEEEENAQDMVDKMNLFGSDPKALYSLNSEYAARRYSTPSPLAGE